MVKKFQPEVLNNHVCSRETLVKVKSDMEGVVETVLAKTCKQP